MSCCNGDEEERKVGEGEVCRDLNERRSELAWCKPQSIDEKKREEVEPECWL
jgi:hypothetical protein